MNDLVWIGSLFGPVGLKGEMKLITDINYQDKIFKEGNSLYINNQPYVIKSLRLVKKSYIISFEGYDHINLINDLLHQDVYIKKGDLLNKDEFLYSEIIGFTIMDENQKVGTVKEILIGIKQFFIKDNHLIIPMIDKYLVKVDLTNKIIYVQNSKELVL